MAVERCDYYSDQEFQQALQQEEEYYQSQQEPDVVPCFKCGETMYQINENPKENICNNCLKKVGK